MCFNSFVESTVDARRQKDANPISNVVAETKKLLAISSYGCQKIDCSRDFVTKYLTDEKTQAAINSKLFAKPNHEINALYELNLAKTKIRNKEPIIVVFFVLQYAKLRLLELYYYNLFTNFCNVNKFNDLGMCTDSLYFAFVEKELEDRIRRQRKS